MVSIYLWSSLGFGRLRQRPCTQATEQHIHIIINKTHFWSFIKSVVLSCHTVLAEHLNCSLKCHLYCSVTWLTKSVFLAKCATEGCNDTHILRSDTIFDFEVKIQFNFRYPRS